MKKIISTLLAMFMVLSLFTLCTIGAAAADKEWTITDLVMMKPEDSLADRCAVRYVFNVTKEEFIAYRGTDAVEGNKWVSAGGIDPGFGARWGIGSGDNYDAYNNGNWGECHWIFDKNGNLCFETLFDNIPGKTAEEEYAEADTLKGFCADVTGNATVICDSEGPARIKDLKANTAMGTTPAIILSMQTEDEYYSYRITDVVTMRPTAESGDYCRTRFVFNITKDDFNVLRGASNDDGLAEALAGAGFDAVWGISNDDFATVADGNAYGWAGNAWLFDANNNLCFDVKFDIAGQTAAEQYQDTIDGKIKGFIQDCTGTDDGMVNYSGSYAVTLPDLATGTKKGDADAIICTAVTEEEYYIGEAIKLAVTGLAANDDGNRYFYAEIGESASYSEGSKLVYEVYLTNPVAGTGAIDPEVNEGGPLRDNGDFNATYHPARVDVSAVANHTWYERSFTLAGESFDKFELCAEGAAVPADFEVYYRNIHIENADGETTWTFDPVKVIGKKSLMACSSGDDFTGWDVTYSGKNPTLTVTTDKVVLNADGTFSFDVAFTGATRYDTWIGVYPDDDDHRIYDGESYGTWSYVGSGNAEDGTPADGTITITNEWYGSEVEDGKYEVGKTYQIVMFYADVAPDGYTVIAKTTVTFEAPDAPETDPETDPVTDLVTDPVTEPETDPIAPPTSDATGIIAIAVVAIAAAGSAIVLGKKRRA